MIICVSEEEISGEVFSRAGLEYGTLLKLKT
jgi:hypothetical protein